MTSPTNSLKDCLYVISTFFDGVIIQTLCFLFAKSIIAVPFQLFFFYALLSSETLATVFSETRIFCSQFSEIMLGTNSHLPCITQCKNSGREKARKGFRFEVHTIQPVRRSLFSPGATTIVLRDNSADNTIVRNHVSSQILSNETWVQFIFVLRLSCFLVIFRLHIRCK